MHPCGRAQNRLVWQQLVTTAHERTVAPGHDVLFVAQDDVAAVRSSRNEEGQRLIAGSFDMRASAVSRSDRFIIERLSDGGAGGMKQTSRWGGEGDIAPRPVFAGAFHGVNLAQVGVARCRGVVRLKEAKKRPGRLSASLKRYSLRLQSRARRLVLKAFGRQVGPEGNVELISVAICWPHQLPKVGGEAFGAFHTAVGHPGMRSAL